MALMTLLGRTINGVSSHRPTDPDTPSGPMTGRSARSVRPEDLPTTTGRAKAALGTNRLVSSRPHFRATRVTTLDEVAEGRRQSRRNRRQRDARRGGEEISRRHRLDVLPRSRRPDRPPVPGARGRGGGPAQQRSSADLPMVKLTFPGQRAPTHIGSLRPRRHSLTIPLHHCRDRIRPTMCGPTN